MDEDIDEDIDEDMGEGIDDLDDLDNPKYQIDKKKGEDEDSEKI